jgi:hypothetical protein
MECLLLILVVAPQQILSFICNSPQRRMTHSWVQLYRQNLLALRSADDPIEIDDVMSEVEMALREADSALSSITTTSPSTNTQTKAVITTTTDPDSTPTNPISLEELQDVISTFIGGIVLGTALGSLANYKIPNIDTLVDPMIPPVLLATIFGSVGVGAALTDSQEGKFIRFLLGTPTMAVVMALTNLLRSVLEALGLAAKRKVEETTSEIKALPGKVAKSAKEKAREAADEIKNIPNRVGNAAKEKTTETIDDVKASVDQTFETILSLPTRTLQELTRGDANQLVPLLIVPLVAATGIVVFRTQF